MHAHYSGNLVAQLKELSQIIQPEGPARRDESGQWEDFLSRQLDFFMETAVTPDRKVEKSIPR